MNLEEAIKAHVRKRLSDLRTRSRFEAKFVRDSPEACWLWTAGIKHGYGWFNFRGKPDFAQRVSFKLYVGPIPSGMCVLHRCDVRLCVNPKHLFLGTRADNAIDMKNKGRANKGEKRWNSKLTDNDVRAIRADPRSHKDIAATYGVSRPIISYVKNHKKWKHLL